MFLTLLIAKVQSVQLVLIDNTETTCNKQFINDDNNSRGNSSIGRLCFVRHTIHLNHEEIEIFITPWILITFLI